MHSSAKMGVPAATLPTMGMRPATASTSSGAWRAGRSTSAMARPLPLPFWMTPSSSMCLRWKCTVEGDFSPTASPISRTEGGYPCSSSVWAMKSYIACCILLSPAILCPSLLFLEQVYHNFSQIATFVLQFFSFFVLHFRRSYGNISFTVILMPSGAFYNGG